VRGMATTKYKFGFFSGKNTSEKTFSLRRASVLGARKLRDSMTVNLPNGVEKTTAPKIAEELFALPQDVAPTYDKSPVIYACDNSETGELAAITPRSCTVEYLHPSGLPVAYSVLRSDYPTDDFIAAEKAMRKPIDDMIAAAKAKNDLENKDK
jgi:hypothetical protein